MTTPLVNPERLSKAGLSRPAERRAGRWLP